MKYALPILISIIFSAFFSGSEIAYTAVNKLRLSKLAEEKGRRSARLANQISDRFDNALSTILIGNNFANIYSSAVATSLAIVICSQFGLSEEMGGTISTIAMTIIILIFGEIVPKIFCKQYSLKVSVAVAWPLKILMVILTPVTFVVMQIVKLASKLWGGADSDSRVTEDEIATIIDTVEEEGVIDEDAGDLLQSALDFHDMTAHEVLTPRINMLAVDIDDSFDEIMAAVTESHFSRIPVYEGSIDHIIGILYLNRFYKEVVDDRRPNIRKMLMKPYFVHKTIKLPALLSEMRRRQTHIAIVLDEYGGTMGIVTMEDILEEIVGDIWDDSDDIKTEFVEHPDGTYEADGTMSIYDFFKELDIDDRDYDSECTTVGGWATEMLDSDPHTGDSFAYKTIEITVSEMRDNCVTKVIATSRDEQSDEEEEK